MRLDLVMEPFLLFFDFAELLFIFLVVLSDEDEFFGGHFPQAVDAYGVGRVLRSVT